MNEQSMMGGKLSPSFRLLNRLGMIGNAERYGHLSGKRPNLGPGLIWLR